MGDKLKVLICGFGAFGALHAKSWRALDPDIELLVADPCATALDRAMQIGIKPENLSTEPAVMLGRADIADIVAPPAYHLPLALMALEAGKPVMIEKPAVRNVSEAHHLMDVAKSSPVQVGLVLRAHPLVAEASRMLTAGEIGPLLAIEGDFSGWKRMRADSSLIENDGVHFLDLMRHFAGVPATSIAAQSWSLIDSNVVDDILIDLTLGKNIKARLRLGVLAAGEREDSFVPGALTNKTLRLIGRKGNLNIDFNKNELSLARVNYTRSAGGHDVKPESLEVQSALGATPEALLARSFGMFVHSVRTGAPVMCDLEQGALELAKILTATETALSTKEYRAVRIDGEAA